MNYIHGIIISLVLASISSYSLSQQRPTQEQIRQAQQAQFQNSTNNVDISQFIQSEGNSIGRNSPVRVPNSSSANNMEPRPFGSNLFNGSFVAERGDGLNSNYKVAPGDKIAIQMWGAINSADVITVDNQGNIFIPDIGPITVKDVPANNLNNVVTSSIKRIYPNNVNVYVNLLTATPVTVFVSGPVERPGEYAGLASDSILFFLSRAGGIDPIRGSYRNISVLREGKEIQTFDLYNFLKQGKLPAFSFKDNDVVFVNEQGGMITVEGSARYPFKFELNPEQKNGGALVEYARPLFKTSHVAISGYRDKQPISVYLEFDEFASFQLRDGDQILFNDDIRPEVISVQLSGHFEGPSFYSIKEGSRLLDLLAHVEVDPQRANYKNVFIKRESVVLQQKQLLEESLQRLERSIFTAPASSDGEAAIRAREAELVSQFIARARQIEPLGKVIVADNNKVANIRLEQGDEIVIPAVSDLIQVSGEVLMPQAIVYNSNADIADYIAWAGGFSERADDQRIAVVRANGITTFASIENGGYWFSSGERLRLLPGDQILVLPEVDAKIMQTVKDITQIIYQIAITANVATN